MEIKMINGKKFELIKDNEGFILEEVENKLTDYYDNFDYINHFNFHKLSLHNRNSNYNSNHNFSSHNT